MLLRPNRGTLDHRGASDVLSPAFSHERVFECGRLLLIWLLFLQNTPLERALVPLLSWKLPCAWMDWSPRVLAANSKGNETKLMNSLYGRWSKCNYGRWTDYLPCGPTDQCTCLFHHLERLHRWTALSIVFLGNQCKCACIRLASSLEFRWLAALVELSCGTAQNPLFCLCVLAARHSERVLLQRCTILLLFVDLLSEWGVDPPLFCFLWWIDLRRVQSRSVDVSRALVSILILEFCLIAKNWSTPTWRCLYHEDIPFPCSVLLLARRIPGNNL